MRVVSISDAADYLGVAAKTLRKWCKANAGPKHIRTPGGRFRFRVSDLDLWINKHAA